MNLKYNARKVAEIEELYKMPITNIISDTTIKTLLVFIQKGLIDENGIHGVSKSVAEDVLDKYLEEKDITDLSLDIMEALVNGGFLPRSMKVDQIRTLKDNQINQALQTIQQ